MSQAIDDVKRFLSMKKSLLFTLVGFLLQLAVLWLDSRTPLGFAHGVLYAPAVFLGLLASSQNSIFAISLLGGIFIAVGAWLSQTHLQGVDQFYIFMNRVLGVGTVVVFAIASSILLYLLNKNKDAKIKIQETLALLEVSASIGRSGGWRVSVSDEKSYWSDELFQLFDIAPGLIPDLETIIKIYAPEHRDLVRDSYYNCAEYGKNFDIEAQVIYRDGSRHWLRIVGKAQKDSSGRIIGVHGAVQDIQKYKHIQFEIETSRAEWRSLAESVPMIVWVADQKGEMIYVNNFTAHYMGIPVEHVLGNGWLESVHPDDISFVKENWTQSLESGAPYLTEFRVKRHDGLWRWHVARAILVVLPNNSSWYGTAMDVQDFRDTERAHTELANRLAQTMECVTDAIFILDSLWNFAFLNRQAETLLEKSRGVLIGKNVWDEFPDARESVFQKQYEYCVEKNQTVRFEAVYAPLNKILDVSVYPANGGVVVYFRDVTEQRRLSEQIQHVQRLDALGQLTGGVAHDFNNILTVIIGNAELLRSHFYNNAETKLFVDMILDAADRGAEMTQRLLAFSRRQILEPKVINVNDLISGIVPMLSRALGENIKINVLLDTALRLVRVDPGQLEAAIINLCINARDAITGDGVLLIETRNVIFEESHVEHYPKIKPGAYVMLSVSDNGCGIDQKIIDKIFDPFFTTKDVGKGTGLGLAMVYGFVMQSNGNVTVSSELGKGSSFCIYLPVSDCVVVEKFKRANQDLSPFGGGRIILLVEDDKLVRMIGRRQLESLGFLVLEAEDGKHAMEVFLNNTDVDLIFTDVLMPGGMTGVQLVSQIRLLRPNIPVVFATGYAEEYFSEKGIFDSCVLLTKPYQKIQLAEKLSQAFAIVSSM